MANIPPNPKAKGSAGSQLNKFSTQNGVTLVELVMVVVLIGILSAVVTPKMAKSDYDVAAFKAETIALLRHAQKSAIAKRRTVCVDIADAGVSAKVYADNPSTLTCADAVALTPPMQVNGGAGMTSSSNGYSLSSFTFTPEGGTDKSSSVIVAINGDSAVIIEPKTGLVHE